jgi:hypothetical protein
MIRAQAPPLLLRARAVIVFHVHLAHPWRAHRIPLFIPYTG